MFFQLVARASTLTEAARELGVTTPTVSKRLAQIELRLGVRLLHRTTRRASLTPEGERYLHDGARIVADLHDLEQAVRKSRDEPKGILRINAPFGFGRRHVAPAVAAYIARYPEVEIQLHYTDRPINLQEQGFDVLIWFGPMPDVRIHARLLLKNRRVLCAAPSYVARYGAPQSVEDLATHRCLILRGDDLAYGNWHFQRGKKTALVKVKGPLSCNDGTSIVTWALAGFGIMVRSEWESRSLIATGKLVQLLPEWSPPDADIYALYSERRRMSARLQTFLDFLAARLQGG